jgi:parallel beta-helix repeat protein
VVVDTTAPETSLVSAPVSGTMQTTASFRFTGSDNATAVGFECRLSGVDADWVDCSSPVTYDAVPVGVNTFEVRAVDYFGNRDATPATHVWTIQSPPPGVPPETSIDSGPDPTTVSTVATFTFSSNEPGVTFECRLDSSAAWESCSSGLTLSGLARTAHTFEVRAIDQENLVDATPAAFSWVITAAPVAAVVACGQTLTQSTLVQNDLTDCLGNGLQIGAAAITVDLGGHTIDGIGLGSGVLNPGFASVTITNGNLQEFDNGVSLGASSSNNIVSSIHATMNQENGVVAGGTGIVVRGSTLVANAVGVSLLSVSDGHIHDNTVTASSGDGIRIEGGGGNRVTDNSISESSAAAVALVDSDGNTVSGNVVASNASGIVIGEVGLGSSANVIELNAISLTSSAGVELIESSGNRVIGNTISEGGSSGIALEDSTDNEIEGNDLRFNAGAISLDGSSGNVIHRNDAGSSNGTGIALETLSFDNEITANRASGNSGEGIYVGDAAGPGQGNLIAGNTASSNSGMGINVNGAGHTIADNVVELNDGWGIFAVPGNVDGGGNIAAGNSEPLQCSGVVCIIGLAPGAPDTSLVLAPPNPSNSSTAVFTFTGIDDLTATFDLGFQCRLDSTIETDFVDCENPWEITGLTPGTHTFEVRAVDQTDVVDPTPAVYVWTYDALPAGVAPDTIIDLAPPLDSPLLEGVFTFSSNEPDVTFECRLDSTSEAAWEPCELFYEFGFEEFQVGLHTFEVRATDLEGNTDPTPATYVWNVGGIITTITDGPAFVAPAEPGEPAEGGETEDRTATFTFESNVPDATFWCSLDLAQFTQCLSPVTYSGLAVGEHLFRVYAVDLEGVEQLEPTEYGWSILSSLDVIPPTATVLSAGVDVNGALRFVFAGSDNITSPAGLVFECILTPDGETPIEIGECTSPLVLPSLEFPEPIAAGDYTFTVVAIDVADNVSDPPALAIVTYNGDTIAPAAPLISPTPNQTGSLELAVAFAAVGDPNVTFECSVVAVTAPATPRVYEPCTSPEAAQVEAPGDFEFAVRAVDLAGNIGPAATVTWTVVPEPVVTFAGTLPEPSTLSTTATFDFVADQAGLTFTCTLEGPLAATTGACTPPVTYSDLDPGEHTFEVFATNSVGLTSETIAHVWTVEGEPVTPPVVLELTRTPAETPTLSTSVSFTFAADQPGASFMCSINEGIAVPCTSGVSYTGLSAGAWPDGVEHTFAVHAVVDGLAGPSVDDEWIVTLPPPDTIAPNTTVGTTPPAVTTSTSASFTFTSNETGSSFECSLDSAPFSSCTSPANFSGLLAGTHTLAVRAIDPAGNVDASPASYTWQVQAPPPDCSTVLTLEPNADAWIDQGSTSSNKGADSTLKVMSKSGSKNLRALVRFGLPATPPPGCVLGSATLRMYAMSSRSGRTLRVDAIAGPWSEGSVTWSNQPAVAGGSATTSSGAGWRQWTVTSQVDAMFTSGANNGFRVRDNQENNDHEQQFASRESSQNRPQLILTFVAAPAPDTTPPETTIDAGPSDGDSTSATFSFSGSDAVTQSAALTFECRVDGGDWSGCTSPTTVAGLDVAAHTFEVRARDAAGNVDLTPAPWTWTVVQDVTAPIASITSSPPTSTSSTQASFSFASSEAGSTFMCSLDGAAYAPCLSTHQVTGLTVATHTLDVYAVDLAGNFDVDSAVRHTWQVVPFVDCGAPVTVTTNADAWIDSGSTSQNKGTDSVLKVRSKSGGINRAVVRFTLPAIPSGCVLQSATLQMHAKSAVNGRTLQAFALGGAAWTENGVTWANQPTTSGAAATTTSGTGWRNWAVAAQVSAMYAGTNNGFLIRDASENNDHEQQFDSREAGANAPRLVLVFAAP